VSEPSWWVGLPRDQFYARVRDEAERLHKLTNDPKLQPRGPETKPAVRGGRTPGSEEV
jgi:hypothetical protein